MAGGPSPSSLSPNNGINSSFIPTSFASSTSPHPHTAFGPQRSMAVDSLPGVGPTAHPFSLNTITARKPMEHAPNTLFSLGQLEPSPTILEMDNLPSILIRKLPRNCNSDVLRSMLLFAKDVADMRFVDFDFPDDKGFQTAIVRFSSLASANDARELLHGKTMGADATPLVVEVHNAPAGRRNTVDGISLRHGPNQASSMAPTNGLRQSSRFNGTFQNLEKLSPPNGMDTLPAPESNSANIQSLFSPQSPLANSTVSKSIINDDPTDETGKLLNDAVTFPKGGDSTNPNMGRRLTAQHMPISRFGNLSLSTANQNAGLTSPPMSAMVSPRSIVPSQSPNPTMSPSGMTPLPGLGPNSAYPMPPQHYHRPNYPPVNPADQNPPCNTLYVGNLPMDTSEDELKAMFSKQRGYKRLCFRTKANGPMCFVEFEDTSFATKTLNELYGQPLHNSVKGGIRLSFSKNPLGVRSGQNTSNHSMMNSHGSMSNMGTHSGQGGFSTATGPPPGLSAPPGFTSPSMPNMNGMNGMNGISAMNGSNGLGLYNTNGFSVAGNGFGGSMRQPLANGVPSSMAGGQYSNMDYHNYR
ncbi:hypothetical protein BT63DRAFT_145962 [Microthyrium microscopicum]|uniref:RRM domain-containing protein n=1 Tax=Microthyrium microscopicum TaxID=703497 RepID=A0A6A6UNQ2_9PEZI|nr:hypothetical protein BT63DRAFT_145962 [Microthyrium microscopicum]